MNYRLVIFSQEEHNLTLPIIQSIINNNRNFDSYLVFLVNDRFSFSRLLKNLIFFGPFHFIKIIYANLIKKIKLGNKKCEIYRMNATEFRSNQWVKYLRGNEFGLSINFPLKISKKIIDQFSGNILNIHNSQLPKYGGLMPILRQINNSDFCFASTIHLINENLDEGRILYQYCLTKEKIISPYKIWQKANNINRNLLIELSPFDYCNLSPMNMSLKSYYSLPSWRNVFDFFYKINKKNFLSLFSPYE
jgi:hypothetical protein